MVVLSCFDGMSCGQIALERAVIPIEKYYASEIDKYAISVTMANYPDTVQLGSITEWQSWNIEKPDIIIGGSPCQGFSFAGKQLNFDDPRSALFFTFIDIIKHFKPKYFLLENVIMKAEYNDVISSILGEIYPECVTQTELFRTGRLEPIQINSALVSAQNRNRLYWTNIPGVTQPKDKGILLKDIIENDPKGHNISQKLVDGFNAKKTEWKGRFNPHSEPFENKAFCLTSRMAKCGSTDNYLTVTGGAFRGRNPENETGKSNALTSVSKDSLVIFDNPPHNNKFKQTATFHKDSNKSKTLLAYAGDKTKGIGIHDDTLHWRKLTPIECERLQTVPDNYTKILDIKYYNLYNMEEIKDGNIICIKNNARLMDVKMKSEHINMEKSVLCITKDLLGMGVLTYLIKNLNLKKNVNIVIEKLEQKDSATGIIKIGDDMEMPYTQIRNIMSRENTDIIKKINIKLMNTDQYMKITLEENSIEMKLFIMLILLKLIIKFQIYTIVKQEANIHFCINSLNLLHENFLEMELLDLKMENIILNSNSQRYKMLGNGWTIDVISHIFRGLK